MLDAFAFALSSAILSVATPSASPAATASPAAAASPTATATPAPAASTVPAVSVSGVLRGTEIFTSNVNATGNLANGGGADLAARFNVSSAFETVTRNTGYFRYGASAGIYSIPVVGLSGNNTFQPGANVNTYGPLPSAYVSINPNDRLSVSAGYLATLIGQENTYTYVNANIQRGLVWNMETAVSRGARVTLTGNKLSGAFEVNDGFFSGHYLGVEGSLTLAPDTNHSYQFVFVIPNSAAPGNWTSAIANKRLYDFMYTSTSGRWNFTPYVLLVQSPQSNALGYAATEDAYGVVFMSTWTMNPKWSLATRIEDLGNESTTQDRSANADLVGYGPGSGAWTFTLTPTYQQNAFILRADLSDVIVRSASPGLTFGTSGLGRNQFRVVLETGVQF